MLLGKLPLDCQIILHHFHMQRITLMSRFLPCLFNCLHFRTSSSLYCAHLPHINLTNGSIAMTEPFPQSQSIMVNLDMVVPSVWWPKYIRRYTMTCANYYQALYSAKWLESWTFPDIPDTGIISLFKIGKNARNLKVSCLFSASPNSKLKFSIYYTIPHKLPSLIPTIKKYSCSIFLAVQIFFIFFLTKIQKIPIKHLHSFRSALVWWWCEQVVLIAVILVTSVLWRSPSPWN